MTPGTLKVLSVTDHLGNANQNHNGISPHTCWDVYYQKDKRTNAGKSVENTAPFDAVGGNANWSSHMENSMDVLQEIKNRATV